MHIVSAAFLAALASGDVQVATRVEVYRDNLLQRTLTDTGSEDGLVIDGVVNVKKGADVRRSCEVSIGLDDDNLDLVPSTPDSLLASYGNELQIARGLFLPGASVPELVQQGRFRISKSRTVDTGDSITIQLSGFDRSRTVSRAGFEDVYVIPAGTNYATAIQTLINSRMSALDFDFTTTGYTTPLLVFEEGQDPWKEALKMAERIGCELFFDVNGRCVLRKEPDPNAVGVSASFVEGEDATFIPPLTRELDDEKTYNKWIVTGESSSGSPVRGTWSDDTPTSPTYYNGRFGKHPTRMTSPFITTTAQATDAAAALGRSKLGLTEALDVTAAVNPALDVGDVIQVTRERAGVNTVLVVDGLTIPLSYAGDMRVDTRERRVFA